MQRTNNTNMKGTVVKIPNVSQEVRIGFSFNYMIKVIDETKNAVGDVERHNHFNADSNPNPRELQLYRLFRIGGRL